MNKSVFVFAVLLLAPMGSSGSDLPELPRDIEEWVRVLVPLRIQVPVTGLYGTEWTTELTAYNESSVLIVHGSPFVCNLGIPCPIPSRQEADSLWSPYSSGIAGPNHGVLFYVERRVADSVWFALTLRERFSGETASIPVVREDDFFAGKTALPDVPISTNHRVHLRIYDPFNEMDSLASITIEDSVTREVLSRKTMMLDKAPQSGPVSEFHRHPGFAEIGDLAGLLPEEYRGSVLVRITMNDERPFWTFISLTDNATQDVTIITPQ
ncbi:MAG TPA: hypothetical protein VMS56_11395 [Thermoanaerobaculia bacterium]|nr:hypothetical protein [Thermoanaerobaculia bacterium]